MPYIQIYVVKNCKYLQNWHFFCIFANNLRLIILENSIIHRKIEMRTIRILSLLLILFCATTSDMYAVGAWPGSGVVGDEWFHYREDTVSTYTRAHAARIAEQNRVRHDRKATFPLTGNVRSIVILVNYSDISFTVPNPNESFTRLLNEPGYADNGGTGSAADYFRASSYDLFFPTFDVYGPYTLPHPRAYYGANDARGNDSNAMQMIIDACMLADNDGVDFSQYDFNNDGVVDNVFVYYAGTNPAEGGPEDAVWPHRMAVYTSVNIDGKRLYDYACTSELTLTVSRKGTMCGIGTFCHEFGHVLGLPDLYNTANGSVYTVGEWDIMAGGNYNNNGCTPPSYSAFERFALGWLTPVQLEQTGDYLLSPLCEESEAYIIASSHHNLSLMNPVPSEYWFVENRQHTGWDTPAAAIPGVGLLITHICHNSGRWNDNTYNNFTPLGYDVCEAYNKNPNFASASDTYPGTVGVTSFVPKQANGVELVDMQLSQIREQNDLQMAFHFGGSDGKGFTLSPADMPQLMNYVLDGESSPQPQKLVITGVELEAERMFVVIPNPMFSISADGETWHTDTLWFPVTSDSITVTATLRYTGTRLCRRQTANMVLGTTAGNYSSVLSLTGYAERPTLISEIEILDSDEISPYAFVARWREQEDAEAYYLTLCKWSDEPQQVKQDFEKFVTVENIAASGWQCNFLRTTTTSFDGRTALLMTAAGDQVVTERYLAPVTQVSFWLAQSYIASDRDSGGELLFESATNDGEWHTVAELKLSSLTQSAVKTYSFSTDEGYVQFRFTCRQSDGSGGIILDGYTANMDKTFEYIYRDTDYPIFAPADSVRVVGLSPNSLYSYQLCCMEQKGCEQHSSPLTSPRFITTRAGESEKSGKITVITRGNDICLYVGGLFVDGDVLYFYDMNGRLVTSVTPNPGVEECRVPAELFQRGKQYLVKLANKSVYNAAVRRDKPYGKLVLMQ